MTLVLNALGRPEPSPEIQRRLRTLHPRLSLRYVESSTEHWAVTMGWDEADSRWEHVKKGDIPSSRAADIVGYLPMLCRTDEAPSYLERMLRTYPSDEAKRTADFVSQWNQTVPLQQAVDEAIGEVLDRADPSGTTKTKRYRT